MKNLIFFSISFFFIHYQYLFTYSQFFKKTVYNILISIRNKTCYEHPLCCFRTNLTSKKLYISQSFHHLFTSSSTFEHIFSIKNYPILFFPPLVKKLFNSLFFNPSESHNLFMEYKGLCTFSKSKCSFYKLFNL